MRFIETTLADAWLIETAIHNDERGYFARLRCAREFSERGLPGSFVQTNLSCNSHAGTFRGLHCQLPPSREGKLVRCISGAIADVIVDLRSDSPTWMQHEWFELSAEALNALYVPSGFAHGFYTEAENSVVLYEMGDYYEPQLGRGIRWDDPALRITLPGTVTSIHPRDAAYPDFDPSSFAGFKRGEAR